MVYKIADNILSPLGGTTQQNYQAVKAGRSALQRYEGHRHLPVPFVASLFSEEQERLFAVEGLTRFESMACTSAQRALAETGIDVSLPNAVFILSSTKANVEQLSTQQDPADVASPAAAAPRIARRLGFTTSPVAVCNACVSGLSAIILGCRLLESGQYDYAVVCGADSLSRFVVSGFQSLMALSPAPCKPFDMERTGLNLGEAAATMVLGRADGAACLPAEGRRCWTIASGAVRNDAYHISTPAKNGEGACLALQAVVAGKPASQLAFINAHGTATMFNDQMESVAIERAGLAAVPVNAYKGYYGHTMGAAGVLETLLSMASIDDHTVLGTRGFEELGVSGKLLLSADTLSTQQTSFVKMLSGFGGCNAAALFEKRRLSASGPASADAAPADGALSAERLLPKRRVVITPLGVSADGQPLAIPDGEKDLLTRLYQHAIGNYPKFYKMDMLSRLGFVAAELLLQGQASCDNILLFNHSSSVCSDRKYLASIRDAGNYFPSPSVFVCTLPNIVAGEMAIRHHCCGETSFYILPERSDRQMQQLLLASLPGFAGKSVVSGWLDYEDDQHFEADLTLYDIKD